MADDYAKDLLTKLSVNAQDVPSFSLSDGVLIFKNRVWLGSNTSL